MHILLDPAVAHGGGVPSVTVDTGRHAGRFGCGATVSVTFVYRVCDAGCSPEEWTTADALWCRVCATVEVDTYVSASSGRVVYGDSSVTIAWVDSDMWPSLARGRPVSDAAAAWRAQRAAAQVAAKAEAHLADVAAAAAEAAEAQGADGGTGDGGASGSVSGGGGGGGGGGDGDGDPAVAPAAVDLPADADVEELPLHVQLYAWGRGQYGVLGLNAGETDASVPTPLAFGRELGLVRVSKVACSWFHSAAITDMGLLYTWGSGADGALGHGTTESLAFPRLVEYFGLVNPLVVKDVACGSDVLGCHTAVVVAPAAGAAVAPSAGTGAGAGAGAGAGVGVGPNQAPPRPRVYTWGIGSALGIGTTKSQWSPQEVAAPELNAATLGGVKSVSCGGGFTAAVTVSGDVFTWGKWSNGRLGLGPAPKAQQNKAVQRYAVHPVQVARLAGTRITAVACGEAHAVALDSTGSLWAFGKGASGQLGTGWTSDCLWPVPVAAPDGTAFVAVAAGAAHSAAIDTNGTLHTWGGAGGLMLGHGDRLLAAGVSKASVRAAAEEVRTWWCGRGLCRER